MNRATFRKLSIAMFGGFLAATLALLMVLSSGLDLTGGSPASAAAWTLPLVAGGLTGLVSWVLARGIEPSGPTCDWRSTGVACPSCGGALRSDWRLCPHCGHRVNAG